MKILVLKMNEIWMQIKNSELSMRDQLSINKWDVFDLKSGRLFGIYIWNSLYIDYIAIKGNLHEQFNCKNTY